MYYVLGMVLGHGDAQGKCMAGETDRAVGDFLTIWCM